MRQAILLQLVTDEFRSIVNSDKGRLLWEEPRPVIVKLKQLSTLRNRLLRTIHQVRTPLKDTKKYLKSSDEMQLQDLCKSSIASLKRDLRQTEKLMVKLIKEDTRLGRLYSIITSINAIGAVIAMEMIIVTNEFKKFSNAKQFASYCGVAPFAFSSGAKIGMATTSGYANKRIKTLFHLAALNALHRDVQLKEYYLRMVSDGHKKMSVISAIRNKLIKRIFACVTEDRLFEKILPVHRID